MRPVYEARYHLDFIVYARATPLDGLKEMAFLVDVQLLTWRRARCAGVRLRSSIPKISVR